MNPSKNILDRSPKNKTVVIETKTILSHIKVSDELANSEVFPEIQKKAITTQNNAFVKGEGKIVNKGKQYDGIFHMNKRLKKIFQDNKIFEDNQIPRDKKELVKIKGIKSSMANYILNTLKGV